MSERRLAVIMFTDMVGFTALTQKNEAQAMDLLEEQRRLLRPVIAKHMGREVKTIGDAFLLEFGSSLEAVKCATEIQTILRNANVGRSQDRRVVLRIGIHLGDVIHIGGDVSGDAVNVASRIEPLAPPGGICVTSQVRDSLLNKVEFGFLDLGTPELKNLLFPVRVYQISGFGEQRRGLVAAKGLSVQDRIAVLPLLNISQEQADEYFADGMTEELISSLSRTRGLRVIARTSVMKYKGTSKTVSEIGRELNVGSVLEGSVRKAGGSVRITVQLIDTSNEEPRWSQVYDREITDIFSIQSDIGRNVAEALRNQVLGGIEVQERPAPKVNADAYVTYLHGRQLLNKGTEADLKSAIELFRRAIGTDGSFAKAYSGLADSYATLALLEFMPPREAFPKAKEAVERALLLDPQLAEAHTSMGLIMSRFEWNWEGAEGEFREALGVNPNYAMTHFYFADYLKAMGRFDEALAEVRKAQELDPLSLFINTGVGHVLYLTRQYDKAIEQYRKAVELDPNFMATHVWFGRPYLEKGMYAEAISELETAVRLAGESTLALAMLGHVLASAGHKEEAMGVLGRLMEKAGMQYVPSYWIAVVYNGLKDREQIMIWMRKAFEERSSWLYWANVEPRFDWLRKDPDFASLMSAMKFPS